MRFLDLQISKKNIPNAKLVHYQPSYNTSHTQLNSDPLLLADGNLRCGQPRIDFPYYEISGPDICSLICVAVYSNNGDLKSLISPRFNLWHTYYYIWSMYLLLKTRQHPSCAHSGKNVLFCITSNNNLFSNQIWIRSESYNYWSAVWDLISYSNRAYLGNCKWFSN